jgi:hypothetical protein
MSKCYQSTFGENMMKSVIVSTIAALGIGFAGCLFAEDERVPQSETDVQVAPYEINLSAPGLDTVTMHTLLKKSNGCAVSLVNLSVTPEDGGDELNHTFENIIAINDPENPDDDEYLQKDLVFSTDSLGNIVVKIIGWDDLRNSGDVPVGTGVFKLDAECDEVDASGQDSAQIIDPKAR